jgi:hypothetical protein
MFSGDSSKRSEIHSKASSIFIISEVQGLRFRVQGLRRKVKG